MIPYILHATVILSVCLLFYKIFLQKETFYRLNRWLLLSCLAIAFSLPLLPIPSQWSLAKTWNLPVSGKSRQLKTPVLSSTQAQMQPMTAAGAAPHTAKSLRAQPDPSLHSQTASSSIPGTASPASSACPVSSSDQASTVSRSSARGSFVSTLLSRLAGISYIAWLSGVIVFGIGLLAQIVILMRRVYTRPVIRDGRFRIIRMTGDHAPCSFGRYIFINPSRYDDDTCQQILLHEKAHAGGWHSFDILLAELCIVAQWFNPFAWIYRKTVENNLEFLADRAVLSDPRVERSSYQMSLLKVSVPHMQLNITSNYNQSLLKRRIIMMNSKHSPLYTVWKYAFLLPILFLLVCTLNRSGAIAQNVRSAAVGAAPGPTAHVVAAPFVSVQTAPGVKTFALSDPDPQIRVAVDQADDTARPDKQEDRTRGSWFATSRDDKLWLELKGQDGDNHWSNNTSVPRSEFTGLTGMGKVEFKLVRDAGTMTFSGQFDGDQGFGHYAFTADPGYAEHLRSRDIHVSENDLVSFFFVNMKKGYVDMVQANGFPHISKGHLIAMTALQVDEPFIQMWRQGGYADISEEKLISAKSLGMDKAWLDDIRAAGYDHASLDKLISFKALGIDGGYVRRLNQAKGGAAGDPSEEDIISYKSLGIDSAYIASLKRAGYADLPYRDIISFKSIGITGDYIESFNAIGYRRIAARDLISLRALSITPEYVRDLRDLGYQDLRPNSLMSLKSLGVTAEFIKSFRDIGYKEIPAEHLTSLKSLGITAAYVKGFQAIGYKDIPLENLHSLKAMGITPEFVKDFNSLGYKNIPLNQLGSLKALGVNADYVRKMREKGFVSDDLEKYMRLKNAF